jgi:hypothetical protein
VRTEIQTHVELATRFLKQRFSDAQCAFVAGSLIRGDGTPFSDLDIVVLYDHLPTAYRESFVFDERPIEAFVHDFSTLRYFFESLDANSGRPSLPTMISEGIGIALSGSIQSEAQDLARSILSKGPDPLTSLEIEKRRYLITDSIDDIRAPKSHPEAIASLAKLYDQLADFALRSNGSWSAAGKWLPRALRALDPLLADEFDVSFREGFSTGHTQAVVELARKILEPHGGFHFEGYRQDAPKDWRKS